MEESKKHNTKTITARIILGIGIIFLMIALIFGFRILTHFQQNPPRKFEETNTELIQNWMTPHYISKIYHIPESELNRLLYIDSMNSKTSLERIARQEKRDEAFFLEQVKKSVKELQKPHPSI